MRRIVAMSLLTSVLTAGILIVAALVLPQSKILSGLLTPIRVSTPSTPPAPATVTVITSTLSYGDALKTYEEIAAKAIEASERALNMMKWLVGAIFALITLASSAAAYLFKTAKLADERSKSAEISAQKVYESTIASRAQVELLSQKLTSLDDKTQQIDVVLKDLSDLKALDWRFLKTLCEINGYRDGLKSDDARARVRRVWELGEIAAELSPYGAREILEDLIEVSEKDDSPFVRKECARVLGEVGHPSKKIALRLTEMMENDCDKEVRQTAREALEKLNSY